MVTFRAAYAADVGDQRDFVGHRGRRAAGDRCCAGRQRRRSVVGACVRLRRAGFCVHQHIWRLPCDPAHAGDVQEKAEVTGQGT